MPQSSTTDDNVEVEIQKTTPVHVNQNIPLTKNDPNHLLNVESESIAAKIPNFREIQKTIKLKVSVKINASDIVRELQLIQNSEKV